MNRVLVASDLSRRSDLAVAQALFLSRRFDAPLTVLHVVDDELPTAIFDSAREQARSSLRGTVEALSGAGTVPVDVRVVGGLDFQAIVDAAEAEDASLIVLGAHRRNLLKDVLTGTTVERVIRNTTRPVLVVRRPSPGDYVCTLAAVDLVEESAEVVRMAHRLAAGNTLYLMHALNDAVVLQMRVADAPDGEIDRYRLATEERARAFLRTIAGRAGLDAANYLPVLDWKGVVPRFLEAAQTFRTDLGVVGTRTHAKGAVERFLLGSVAEDLLLNMPCDVLAVPLRDHTPLPGAGGLATLG
ncbi:universal stress protein [Azospirillum sp.]|uniref:universal stress protein n=1 Tax=Azospirillum sp. TaxID=34012 RepID=UPI002D3914E5|nr:universal stress protein [Azospirillum sp.]HYD69193.1 universal stress protein [Azospirillum sp.]